MMYRKKNSKSEDDHLSQVVKAGRYRRNPPSSPQIPESSSNVIRHPTAVKRSEHVITSTGSNKSIRSLSVPSLHATAEKVKYSPPPSDHKPRSKSVRVSNNTAKKASSFKRNIRKLFGSHLELDENAIDNEQRVVGTYRPINFSRPRSIGGSSDCSNSSTYTTDFSRCNSLRDSSRSRVSHNDSVFHQGVRQASCDSNDAYTTPNHVPSSSTDSSYKFSSMQHALRSGEAMYRSNSSTSLKNFGIQTKTDPRYYSVATDSPYMVEEHGSGSRRTLTRHILVRPGDDSESLWEDSQSFTYVNNKSVLPSDPEYRQVAEELMSASPTHKMSNDASQFNIDPRRMSDASIDPRRVSMDSGVDSLSAAGRLNRSVPTTPITIIPTNRERATTPHGYLSQEGSSPSLPPGWDVGYTDQGLIYYLDNTTQSTHWELPHSTDDSLGLPSGWEAVRSGQYGTYYVNHNNKTAIYQHPYHSRSPPPYQRPSSLEDEDTRLSRGDRKAPARSHSHRSSQSHRVLDQNSSLLRRSKSIQNKGGDVSHERQLSVVTFVPPSPYQSKEIPQWLKKYVESPDLAREMQPQWMQASYDDLTGWDTMIKRLLKKGSEQIVKVYEYYRVAIQQELEERRQEEEERRLREGKQLYQILQQQQQPPSSPAAYQPSSPASFQPSSPAAYQQILEPNEDQSPHSLRQSYHSGSHLLHQHHPPYHQYPSSDIPPPLILQSGQTMHHQVPLLLPAATQLSSQQQQQQQQQSSPQSPLTSHHHHRHHKKPTSSSTHHSSSSAPHLPLHPPNDIHHHHHNINEENYNTMIKKDRTEGLYWGALNSSSNGLRRVESEGSQFIPANVVQSNAKGYPFRSTDSMTSLTRQGSGFSEIFEKAQQTESLQETFV